MHRFRLQSIVLGMLACLAAPPALNAQGPGSGEMSRGVKCAEEGQYDKAIEWYTEALRVAPEWGHLYFLRGHAWDKKREYDKAIADYTEELRRTPEDAAAWVGRGVSWSKKGEYDKAIDDFTGALKINRGDVYFYYNVKESKFDQTIADGKQILRLRHADAYRNRGDAWVKKGEYARAVADYEEAVRIRPNDAEAVCAFARLRATCPDAKYRNGKEAMENAHRAYKLGAQDWACVDTLAAACAENGDFDKATQWQEEAIGLAANDKSASDKNKEELRLRLELYRAKKPYRETVNVPRR